MVLSGARSGADTSGTVARRASVAASVDASVTGAPPLALWWTPVADLGGVARHVLDAARRGDWDTARSEQERINRMFDIVFQPTGLSGDATGVGAFKAAMKARGLIEHATMAHTVTPLDADAVDKVSGVLAGVELLPTAMR